MYFYLTSAWKSGKKPSESKLANSKNSPNSSVFLPSYVKLASGSKNLNIKIPAVTNMATKIFFGPSFSFLSVTLEHKTPTKITESILHDFTIIVKGKLTKNIASVLVIDEKNIMKPQMARFLLGILDLSPAGIV